MALPPDLGHLFHLAAGSDRSGDVHQDVDLPDLLLAGVDHPVDVLLHGDIALDGDGRDTEFPLQFRRNGLRLPGAWDPFEIGVRVILGQQVSVAGASTTTSPRTTPATRRCRRS